ALPGFPRAVALFTRFECVTWIAIALAHASLALLAKGEPRNLNLRDGDGHQVLALFSDHLAMRNVIAKPLADLPANDIAKSGVVALDLKCHVTLPGTAPEVVTLTLVATSLLL